MARITGYGKDVVRNVVVICVVLTVLTFLIPVNSVRVIILFTIILLLAFTFYFFRDPEREIPDDLLNRLLISPADGKVVLIEEVINKEKNLFEEGEPLRQISIFLSPLNVHVNRVPVSGVVKYLKYIKGDYIVAFNHKSSEKNERTEIGIENDESGAKVLFKQIAGFVARRIVYNIKPGSYVKSGETFGMIKFGSRVDILIKPDIKVLVKIGDKVTGGETIIAEFN